MKKKKLLKLLLAPHSDKDHILDTVAISRLDEALVASTETLRCLYELETLEDFQFKDLQKNYWVAMGACEMIEYLSGEARSSERSLVKAYYDHHHIY